MTPRSSRPRPRGVMLPSVALPLLLAAATDDSDLTGISGWIADVIEKLDAVGVGLLIILETVFPPIPSEVVLLLAGFVAGQGEISLVAIIVAATVGSVAGSLILYAAGAVLGRQRFYRIVDWMPLVDVADMQVAEKWFVRRGRAAVFFGRLIPLVRSGISVPAGLTRMPLGQFILYTAIGSGIWNTLFILLGYWVGDQWQDVGHYSDYINRAILALVVIAVLWYVFRVYRRRGRTVDRF